MGMLLAIVGWFMAIVGIAIALVFPYLEGGKHTLLDNLVPWVIPVVGLFLLLFSNKMSGKDKQKMKKERHFKIDRLFDYGSAR